MKSYVLDSYAVLTYFQNEAGAEQVEKLLADAETGDVNLFLSAVNLGETAYITQRKAGVEGKRSLLLAIEALPIRIKEVTKEQALNAAEIKAQCAIAFADCFAIALARSLEAPVVTGDPEFKKAASLVIVDWLPHK
ncbi:MAG: type II toxin-antitoxin system VapC family toxin [Firmicutes bacterium]|nr:type II toxin-antitoxin system VapC family toxin [Bacillota bacterium]